MTAAGRLPAEDSVAPAVRSVFLLEDQPDHAELMLEALGNRLPGVHVCWPFGRECGHTDADVLVISLASDPALVRAVLAQRPALLARPAVVLSGAGDRWTPADLAGIREAARLDKRSGGEFLRALPEAVARVAVPRDARAPSPAPPSVGPAPPAAPAAAPPSRPEPAERPPRPLPDRSPADEAAGMDQRCTELVAGLLADTLGTVLGNVAPLTDLLRRRHPDDIALQRYVASLEEEVARARAVARRLHAVIGQEGSRLPRRLHVAALIGLRVHAWELLAPPGIDIVVRAAHETPGLEVQPEILGKALDDLVAALLARAAHPGLLRIEVGALLAGAQECAVRRGLRPGRYARVLFALEPRVLARAPELVAAAPVARREERALAAIKAHGGYLALWNDRERDAPARIEILLPPPPARRAAVVPAGPASLLLVDDEDAVRRVGREMLRSDGYIVADAPSGEDAVALYGAGCRYDLVLLDLALGGGMNGVATFRALRAVDPNAAIILVSGSVNATQLRGLLGDGLLGFLPKPFNMRQLLEAARAGLGASVGVG